MSLLPYSEPSLLLHAVYFGYKIPPIHMLIRQLSLHMTCNTGVASKNKICKEKHYLTYTCKCLWSMKSSAYKIKHKVATWH